MKIWNETIIILRSDGTLFTFFTEAIQPKVRKVKEWNDILPMNRENADQQTNQVYLLCKNCKGDKKPDDVWFYFYL
ncbi:hypothetical protein CS542_09980 [Pedobacter sp. IW39]|nr:hypothetical protein CS542_09980 [Pedobacter sp. IW39]